MSAIPAMADMPATAVPRPAALPLAAVNALPHDAFVAAFGPVFEHAPWVAGRAWCARPFASADDLHAVMMNVVRSAPRATQVAFLCLHPELAGREARAGTMTEHSTAEQSSAGLGALNAAEAETLRGLNARYRERHGFPFIIAVRRHTRAQIFEQLQRRLERDSGVELVEALAQVAVISRLRLEAMLAN